MVLITCKNQNDESSSNKLSLSRKKRQTSDSKSCPLLNIINLEANKLKEQQKIANKKQQLLTTAMRR